MNEVNLYADREGSMWICSTDDAAIRGRLLIHNVPWEPNKRYLLVKYNKSCKQLDHCSKLECMCRITYVYDDSVEIISAHATYFGSKRAGQRLEKELNEASCMRTARPRVVMKKLN